MVIFLTTSYLTEILEKSQKEPVIIFKYSSECGSSDRLAKKLEKAQSEKTITQPIYKITVQKQPALSQAIADFFSITHETPQVFVIHKGKLKYTAHHADIDIENLKTSS